MPTLVSRRNMLRSLVRASFPKSPLPKKHPRMADITDPTVIAYVNEAIRPFSDRLVGLSASMDIEIAKWFQVISPLISGNLDGDVVIDGSAEDGRTPITKADLANFVTQLMAIQTQFDGGGVFDVISKPHVNVIMP